MKSAEEKKGSLSVVGGERKKEDEQEGKKNDGGLKRYLTVFNSILSPICCSLLTWFGHDFSAGQFLSVHTFLSRQRHYILDFS